MKETLFFFLKCGRGSNIFLIRKINRKLIELFFFDNSFHSFLGSLLGSTLLSSIGISLLDWELGSGSLDLSGLLLDGLRGRLGDGSLLGFLSLLSLDSLLLDGFLGNRLGLRLGHRLRLGSGVRFSGLVWVSSVPDLNSLLIGFKFLLEGFFESVLLFLVNLFPGFLQSLFSLWLISLWVALLISLEESVSESEISVLGLFWLVTHCF